MNADEPRVVKVAAEPVTAPANVDPPSMCRLVEVMLCAVKADEPRVVKVAAEPPIVPANVEPPVTWRLAREDVPETTKLVEVTLCAVNADELTVLAVIVPPKVEAPVTTRFVEVTLCAVRRDDPRVPENVPPEETTVCAVTFRSESESAVPLMSSSCRSAESLTVSLPLIVIAEEVIAPANVDPLEMCRLVEVTE